MIDEADRMSKDWTKPTSARAARWEAAGLGWLTVDGGARVVQVRRVTDRSLVLERLRDVGRPSTGAAEDFGRRLAVTHAAGASAYGVGPDDWDGDGYQGPNEGLLPLPLGSYERWGQMYADLRIEPLVRRSSELRAAGAVFQKLCQRLRSGDFDTGEPPARMHGDLWSGNVVWTEDGAVLIDPSAHAGHRENDLAALTLFGCPGLDRIVAAYDEVSPLADGWRDRIELHQLHLVVMHAVVFGGGYVRRAIETARTYG